MFLLLSMRYLDIEMRNYNFGFKFCFIYLTVAYILNKLNIYLKSNAIIIIIWDLLRIKQFVYL